MTAVAERLRELVDRYDAPDLPPLAGELCRSLDLPADLPAELSIAQVAELTGVSAHTLRYYERVGSSPSLATKVGIGSMTGTRWAG